LDEPACLSVARQNLHDPDSIQDVSLLPPADGVNGSIELSSSQWSIFVVHPDSAAN